MPTLRRKFTLGLTGLVGLALLTLLASAVTGFSTWPWQKTHVYEDGELGLHIGASRLDVWKQILRLQRKGVLVPGAGRNNNSRASTTDFTQVASLDWWSFPSPPCCRCSVDLTFKNDSLKSFEKHCNYAPEGP
jgi:hypothetical protein